MAKYLEGKDFDTIELCGLVSNICVLSNAVMAKSACPNSEIIVDSSLTAAADEEMHQKSLDVMKGLFIKITLKIEKNRIIEYFFNNCAFKKYQNGYFCI